MTKEECSLISSLREQGMSWNAIARKVDRPWDTVRRAVDTEWRDNRNAQKRQQYQDNPEHYRFYSGQWRLVNPSEAHQTNLRSRQKHAVSNCLVSAKARAKKAGIPFNITISDMPKDADHCQKCGSVIICAIGNGSLAPTSRSIDRIIPSLGYVPGNVAWLCMKCNMEKQNLTASEHRSWADWIEENAA
jgi:hypothetical protein